MFGLKVDGFKSIMPLLARATAAEEIAGRPMLIPAPEPARTMSTLELSRAENDNELQRLKARFAKLEVSLARTNQDLRDTRRAIIAREAAARLMGAE